MMRVREWLYRRPLWQFVFIAWGGILPFVLLGAYAGNWTAGLPYHPVRMAVFAGFVSVGGVVGAVLRRRRFGAVQQDAGWRS